MTVDLRKLESEIFGLSIEQSIKFLTTQFPHQVKCSSAFGQEDQVLLDLIYRSNLDVEIFTLDTGRLFPETYALIDETSARYNRHIKTYFPSHEKLESLVSKKGFFSFYNSVEDRKDCCYLRKVAPLKRALKDTKVWITGLRASQSDSRQKFNQLEWDESNQVIKYNPLLNWTYDQITEYLQINDVPSNSLHDQGFISIGCQPCTRAIKTGEDPRAGRWWWETSQKECGLHSA
ncbi:MAG: phosphoadenosine phosphosulfate reductase [Roseivirga sp.]|jgi:phosphoadenosine phosphosulfate reductase